MTKEDFRQWLTAMKKTLRVNSDAECAQLLGVSKTAVQDFKKRGADRRTALACRALIHSLKPYGE